MRTLCRIYQRSDGGIAIVVPNWDDSLCGFGKTPHKTEAEWYEWAVTVHQPSSFVKLADVPVLAFPTTREFREAWEFDGQSVSVSLPKAKNIAHAKRRESRAKEFTPLDIEATIPSKAAQAEAMRQAIRDKYAAIQMDIDSAVDVQSLEMIVRALP